MLAVATRRSMLFKSFETDRIAGGRPCPPQSAYANRKADFRLLDRIKRKKGVWWMPWHREAMKDVALCENLW